MHLQLLCVRGYKRFADEARMDTRGPVIAVVGPNEAGKTSFLRAAEHLSIDSGIPQVDLTDHKPVGDEWVVSGHFSLEPEERKQLREWLPAKANLTYSYYRYADGRAEWSTSPDLPRDLRPRRRAVAALRKALEQGWLPDVEDEETGRSLKDRAAWVAPEAETDNDWLPEQVRAELRDGATAFERVAAESSPDRLRALTKRLREAATAEDAPTPGEQVNAVLKSRVPRFLFFSSSQRQLKCEYRWDQTPTAPPALADLFELAGVDFEEYRVAATGDDRPRLDTLNESANGNLEEAFRAWNQAELHVSFSSTPESLQLIIRDSATASRTRLDEHSDGLLAFISLFAFTATNAGGRRPVLLIDEAEHHLHYDGQADLVRVFERQKLADTVIYTTHSIGCLPSDLGAAIRVVARLPGGARRSAVRNSFWAGAPDDARVGLTPMMLAMGAEALAFTPARRAVIGEGASEAILLPSLIRESLPPTQQREPLGYQVAPGVADVDPDRVEFLEQDAGRVVYLIDNDEGGRGHRRKLPERAKEEGRVVLLGEEEDLALEDLVDATALVEGLSGLLRRLRVDAEPPRADELPALGRGKFLAKWCRGHGVKLAQHKGALAQEALDAGRLSGRLMQRERRDHLRDLHKRLRAASEPPKTRRGKNEDS